MAYTPKPEDIIDAPELNNEESLGEVASTPAETVAVEASVMESTKAMNALGERTPVETAQIASLEQALKQPSVAEKEEQPIPTESSLGEEITPEGLEMAKVNAELEEYLGSNKKGESLEVQLVGKEEANKESEKKSFKRFGWTSMGVGAASGVSALASAGGLGGAAMAGGFGAAALGGLFAAPAILAVGGAYWGGKKLWNKYQENKARKNIDRVRGDR